MLFRVFLSKFCGFVEPIKPMLMMPIWTSEILISLDDIDLQMNQESSDFYKAFIDPYSFTMAISDCFCPKIAALILSQKFSIVLYFFRIWQIKYDQSKIGLTQKCANSKRSTIFFQSSWYFSKMTSSWMGNFGNISAWLNENGRFFINSTNLS